MAGNTIGTDASGTAGLGNGTGVYANGPATIGGTGPGQGNVISGNTLSGIHFDLAAGGTIAANLIGTKPDGSSPLGNGGAGIAIDQEGIGNNTIGGTGRRRGERDRLQLARRLRPGNRARRLDPRQLDLLEQRPRHRPRPRRRDPERRRRRGHGPERGAELPAPDDRHGRRGRQGERRRLGQRLAAGVVLHPRRLRERRLRSVRQRRGQAVARELQHAGGRVRHRRLDCGHGHLGRGDHRDGDRHVRRHVRVLAVPRGRRRRWLAHGRRRAGSCPRRGRPLGVRHRGLGDLGLRGRRHEHLARPRRSQGGRDRDRRSHEHRPRSVGRPARAGAVLAAARPAAVLFRLDGRNVAGDRRERAGRAPARRAAASPRARWTTVSASRCRRTRRRARSGSTSRRIEPPAG